MGSVFLSVLHRDLALAWRRRSDALGSVVFFLIVVSLFPLGIGPEKTTLRQIAPGIFWVAALLASVLSLGRLFNQDHQDGSLEQMVLSPHPLTWIVAGKVLAHWLSSGCLMVILSPLLAMQFGLSTDAIEVLVLSLLIGTPILSLIGAIGAALTLGLSGGGVLISLLVLPLYIPVLVFGAGAVESHVQGLDGSAHLYLLAAVLLCSIVGAPWATAQALRLATE